MNSFKRACAAQFYESEQLVELFYPEQIVWIEISTSLVPVRVSYMWCTTLPDRLVKYGNDRVEMG